MASQKAVSGLTERKEGRKEGRKEERRVAGGGGSMTCVHI
jgi:hypothetical protein